MNFTQISSLTLPEGKVVKISNNGIVLWSQQKEEVVLPDEYQKIEWISVAANGKAYIDLGFPFDTAATITLEQWLTGTTATAYPFGAAENSGVYRCLLTCPYGGSATTGGLFGSNGSNYISSTNANCIIGKNTFIMKVKQGELSLQVNNVMSNISVTQAAYTMSNNLYLFAQNYNGSARFGGLRQLGYFLYRDKNNIKICELYPCYRKSDNVIGMYDIIRNTFLTNIGTGTFTAGPEI